MENEVKVSKQKKPRGYNKRLRVEREADILFCTNLFLRGYSYREIAKHLNIELAKRNATYELTFQMVYYDMNQVIAEWKAEQKQDIGDYVSQELKKLDRMENELWEAWEKSKVIERKKTRRNRMDNVDPDDKTRRYGDYGYSETSTETTPGDSKYFDLLLRVWDKRAKLVGYDVAEKVKIMRDGDEEEGDTPIDEIMTDEEMIAMADRIANAKSAKIKAEKDASNNE